MVIRLCEGELSLVAVPMLLMLPSASVDRLAFLYTTQKLFDSQLEQ